MNANMMLHSLNQVTSHACLNACNSSCLKQQLLHTPQYYNMSPNTEQKANKFTKVRNNALSHCHLLIAMQPLYSTICGAALQS